MGKSYCRRDVREKARGGRGGGCVRRDGERESGVGREGCVDITVALICKV